MAWIASLLAPYLFRIIIGVVIVGAMGASWLALKIHYEDIGYNRAVHAIAAKDERAVHAVQNAIKTVKDCVDRGGSWDTSSGLCQY